MSAAAGRVVVCAALLVSVWACWQTGQKEQMTAELNVFSGRPNPQWTLTEAEVTRIETLLGDLPQAEEAVEPGLGYRGFVLMAGTRRITVGKGIVRIEEKGRIQMHQDAKGLEVYLRELAKEHGYEKLIEIL